MAENFPPAWHPIAPKYLAQAAKSFESMKRARILADEYAEEETPRPRGQVDFSANTD